MTKMSFNLTRRQVIKTLAATAGAHAAGRLAFAQAAATKSMTARQVIDTIKAHLDMTWNDKTYRDTFKSGDPETPVKGIASCFMSTFEVIKKAHAQGLNLVISHEPTYWSDADLIEPVKNDPLYQEKRHFIESNGMVVWRIHDHWHRRRPDPMQAGTERLLQWEVIDPDKRIYKIPTTTLRDLAEFVAKRLFTTSVRFVGDPNLVVNTLGRGAHVLSGNAVAYETADVVMTSEVREWESVEYARDLIATGAKKGFILLAHEAGEEEGMVLFAEWMKTILPEMRTVDIPTNDYLYFV